MCREYRHQYAFHLAPVGAIALDDAESEESPKQGEYHVMTHQVKAVMRQCPRYLGDECAHHLNNEIP